MAEWTSVIAVFWALWALDGVRLGPRSQFTWIGGVRRNGARVLFNRWSLPGVWPTSWRAGGADVPLALSPAGICNRPAGAMGRPVELPATVAAWRWEEIREVGVARGWLFINGARFCPDTGHLTGAQLLELARLPAERREARIRSLVGRWLRPTHLRRRATVLRARTATAALLNTIALSSLAAISLYVMADGATYLPTRWGDALARALPWLLTYLLGLHVAAVVLAWRALRRLRVRGPDRRRSALVSALLLPPQALRLRMLAGEGFFPVQHPLAAALAWAKRGAQGEAAFAVLADLRWPLGETGQAALAREVGAWFRAALEGRVLDLLRVNAIASEELFLPPAPNARASCSYCPRCGDQFGAGPRECPHGIALRPLRGRSAT